MKATKFGPKVRELRKKTGMSQKEVAEKVKINFTYLSKIENGTTPPPSQDTIRRLAKILNTDEYELITLAGKVPSDLEKLIVRDKQILQYLRSQKTGDDSHSVKGE